MIMFLQNFIIKILKIIIYKIPVVLKIPNILKLVSNLNNFQPNNYIFDLK